MGATDDAEILRLYLRGRDVGCPKCRYNMRDSPTGVCPECGTVLRLHVHPTLVKLPPSHVLGILGLAAGLVLGALCAVAGIAKGPLPLVLGVLIAAWSIVGLALWDRLFFRARLRHRTRVPWLVAGAWAGAAAALSAIAGLVLRLF